MLLTFSKSLKLNPFPEPHKPVMWLKMATHYHKRSITVRTFSVICCIQMHNQLCYSSQNSSITLRHHCLQMVVRDFRIFTSFSRYISSMLIFSTKIVLFLWMHIVQGRRKLWRIASNILHINLSRNERRFNFFPYHVPSSTWLCFGTFPIFSQLSVVGFLISFFQMKALIDSCQIKWKRTI